MIRWRQRIVRRCGWLALLLVIAGCGPAKTEVSGIVRYKGEPLTSGDVLVVDADGMTYATPISSEGGYTAHGIPVGPARFAVLTGVRPQNVEKPRKRQPGERRGNTGLIERDTSKTPVKPQLPARYAAVGTSGLSTTLQPGPNTFDLDLE
jgi:hypothetical protein